MFTPIGNNIIIDPITVKEQNISETGIDLGTNDDVQARTVSSGKVLSVGLNVSEIEVRDTVIYEIHAAHYFEVGGKPHISIQESSIIGYNRG